MAGLDRAAAFGASPPRRKTPLIYLRARVLNAVPFLMIAFVLAGWEAVAHSRLVTPFMLPAIETVARQIEADVSSGSFAVNVAATLYRTLVGFGVAAVAGVALGVLMSRVRLFHWFFDPIISVGFPVPKVALLPIFILWFGLFDLSKIMLIITNAIFPVVTATVQGLRGVDRHLIWSARSLGASEQRVGWEIVVPAALPQILTGLQIALPISLIVAIVSEIVMSGDGLGGVMIDAARYLNSPAVFAGIVEIGATGFVLIKCMEIIRRRLLIWHSETTINLMQ